jgi:hypothetical protein
MTRVARSGMLAKKTGITKPKENGTDAAFKTTGNPDISDLELGIPSRKLRHLSRALAFRLEDH